MSSVNGNIIFDLCQLFLGRKLGRKTRPLYVYVFGLYHTNELIKLNINLYVSPLHRDVKELGVPHILGLEGWSPIPINKKRCAPLSCRIVAAHYVRTGRSYEL